MAEVLDIITKLQFEANTGALDKSINSIEKEIKSVDELTSSIVRLDQLRDRTDKANLAALAKIDAALENRKNKLRQEIQLIDAKIRTDENLRKSLAQTGLEYIRIGDRLDKFRGSSTRAMQSLTDLGRIVQDAPYGFIGIANNINPALESFQRLRKESGSLGGAIKSLGSSLIGGGGLGIALSIATSLLVVFGDSLFSSGKEAKNATKEISDYDKAIQETAQSISSEVAELQKLLAVSRNANLTYKERGKAVDDLQSKYPDYFGNLDREKILNGQVGATYRALTEDIIARAKATTQYNIIATEAGEIAAAQLKLEQIRKRDGVFFGNDQAEKDAINIEEGRIKLAEQRIKNARRSIDAENALGVAEAYWLDQNDKKRYEKNKEAGKEEALLTEEQRKEQKKRDRELERSAKKAESLEKQRLKALDNVKFSNVKDDLSEIGNDIKYGSQRVDLELKILEDILFNRQLTGVSDSDPFKQYAQSVKRGLSGLETEIISAIGPGTSDKESQSIFQSIVDAQIRNETKLEELRKQRDKLSRKKRLSEEEKLEQEILEIKVANVQKGVEVANQAISVAASIANAIVDIEIQKQDRIVQIQSDRVNQAVELAKRGNVEILQAETDRLEKAQQERERLARQQIQLNALLQASNNAVALSEAIGAIISAAAKGDPYTIAARVIAAVAALVGGVLSLKSAFSDASSTGFKDGKVDIQGPGTATSDSIPARISRGESVINALSTKKYKPILEAINNDTFNYSRMGRGFGDNKKELISIKDSIDNLHFQATNNVDRNGVHQMVQTTLKENRRKWN